MSSPAAAKRPPAPECPTSQVGPCAGCGHPTMRYGPGGNPLCVICRAPVLAGQTKAPQA